MLHLRFLQQAPLLVHFAALDLTLAQKVQASVQVHASELRVRNFRFWLKIEAIGLLFSFRQVVLLALEYCVPLECTDLEVRIEKVMNCSVMGESNLSHLKIYCTQPPFAGQPSC